MKVKIRGYFNAQSQRKYRVIDITTKAIIGSGFPTKQAAYDWIKETYGTLATEV